MRLILYREEQQPLENFFRAKGIKTKNEMADDVSNTSHPYGLSANETMHSPELFLQLLFKMKILRPVMMDSRRTAVVPTKTMRVSMRTSKQIPSRR